MARGKSRWPSVERAKKSMPSGRYSCKRWTESLCPSKIPSIVVAPLRASQPYATIHRRYGEGTVQLGSNARSMKNSPNARLSPNPESIWLGTRGLAAPDLSLVSFGRSLGVPVTAAPRRGGSPACARRSARLGEIAQWQLGCLFHAIEHDVGVDVGDAPVRQQHVIENPRQDFEIRHRHLDQEIRIAGQ